jgi:hypothetical protein
MPGADHIRHKVFISYHHDDQAEVDELIKTFDHQRDAFIARAVGSDQTPQDLIDSDNSDYVMRRIRELYIEDSTVTMVFIGENTWTRKFVDWEITSSLHQGPGAGAPNGLIAVLSLRMKDAIPPDRLYENLRSSYARFYPYPQSRAQLAGWIEDAFQARTERAKKVKNGQTMQGRNLDSKQVAGRPRIAPTSSGLLAPKYLIEDRSIMVKEQRPPREESSSGMGGLIVLGAIALGTFLIIKASEKKSLYKSPPATYGNGEYLRWTFGSGSKERAELSFITEDGYFY